MTFNELTEEEPRLADLEQSMREFAAEVSPGARFCANGPWCRQLKLTLIGLVGFDRTDLRKHHVLRSREAYDTAYHYLYNLLPDCNHDGSICR